MTTLLPTGVGCITTLPLGEKFGMRRDQLVTESARGGDKGSLWFQSHLSSQPQTTHNRCSGLMKSGPHMLWYLNDRFPIVETVPGRIRQCGLVEGDVPLGGGL